jgi:hypothetical protein
MNTRDIINKLKAEWVMDSGFFALVGQGTFDDAGAARVRAVLAQIDFGVSKGLDRELVTYLWFIPIFMAGNTETMDRVYGQRTFYEYLQVTDEFQTKIEQLLGLPKVVEPGEDAENGGSSVMGDTPLP